MIDIVDIDIPISDHANKASRPISDFITISCEITKYRILAEQSSWILTDISAA